MVMTGGPGKSCFMADQCLPMTWWQGSPSGGQRALNRLVQPSRLRRAAHRGLGRCHDTPKPPTGLLGGLAGMLGEWSGANDRHGPHPSHPPAAPRESANARWRVQLVHRLAHGPWRPDKRQDCGGHRQRGRPAGVLPAGRPRRQRATGCRGVTDRTNPPPARIMYPGRTVRRILPADA